MMDVEAFEALATAIQDQGIARDLAELYASLIVDTPEVRAGKWVVRDDSGKVIAFIDPITEDD